MNGKISDFKIAEYLLKLICSINNCKFVDLSIKVGEIEGLYGENIYIKETKNVGQTIYKIIKIYIENSKKIVKKDILSGKNEKSDFLIFLSNFLRGLIYSESKVYIEDDELTLQHLYQRPLVWLIMKDLICPIFDVPLKDVKIVTGTTPYVDIAKYYKENELKDENYPFIFVNEISNPVIRNAFILIETIKFYNLSPHVVIKELLESNLNEKLRGLLKIVFVEDRDVEEFISVIVSILGLKILSFNEILGENKIEKSAQAQSAEHPTTWWYLGVIEEQLENVRGSDWSTYEILNKYVKDFWNKVEKVKSDKAKKGNPEGVPFDVLLRLKADQTVSCEIDHNKTLQALLSSDRIW